MARIINDETFAGLVALLAEDSKVKLFQKLIMSEKTGEKTDALTSADDGTAETEKNQKSEEKGGK